MFKRGLTIVMTSAVGSIRRNISSIGLYACGDSSSVSGQTDVENMPFIDSSKSSIPISFFAAFLDMARPAPCGAEQFQNRDWVTITATVRAEHLPAYGEEPGPVLYAQRIEPAAPAKEEVIQF